MPRPSRLVSRTAALILCGAGFGLAAAESAGAAGNQVSYNGDNWTANQWNYNEVPGGASGAWNSDGSC